MKCSVCDSPSNHNYLGIWIMTLYCHLMITKSTSQYKHWLSWRQVNSLRGRIRDWWYRDGNKGFLKVFWLWDQKTVPWEHPLNLLKSPPITTSPGKHYPMYRKEAILLYYIKALGVCCLCLSALSPVAAAAVTSSGYVSVSVASSLISLFVAVITITYKLLPLPPSSCC